MTDRNIPALTKMRDTLLRGEYPQFDMKHYTKCFLGLALYCNLTLDWLGELPQGELITLICPKDWETDPRYDRVLAAIALDRVISGEPIDERIWREPAPDLDDMEKDKLSDMQT